MKKWLIAIGVLTILVLGLFSAKGTVQVSADGEHTHCICGTGNLNVGDHTAHTSVTWTAWTETGRLPNYSDLQVGENYFYLANNVSFGGAWQPGKDSGGSPHTNMDGRKLILCLNGKTVQCTGNDRLLSSLAAYTSGTAYWAAGLDITITDCQTTGTMKLTSAANTLTQGGLFWMTADNGSLMRRQPLRSTTETPASWTLRTRTDSRCTAAPSRAARLSVSPLLKPRTA